MPPGLVQDTASESSRRRTPALKMPQTVICARASPCYLKRNMAFAVVILATILVLAVSGQVLVQRLFKPETLGDHESLVQAMLGVVGTLFSVLLGLLVAGSIDNYQEVKMQVAAEANACADVFRLARGFGDKERITIRALCRAYGASVIKDEWPEMERHRMSDKTWDIYQQMWEAVVAIDPDQDRENNLQQSILSAMQTLGENRRARAVNSQAALMPILWVTILVGAFITILFTYFFTSQLGALHLVMTGLIAISLGLNIWLLAAYSSPFSGDLSIRPDMFHVLERDVFSAPDTPPRYLELFKGSSK
ncbi:MAG TPA: hypothetical protein V6C72_00415 [Chroococcales cyanobacterium]